MRDNLFLGIMATVRCLVVFQRCVVGRFDSDVILLIVCVGGMLTNDIHN